jgi:hypothetical protein
MTSIAHQVDTPTAPPRVSRRRVLGRGAATALVAGTGLLSYRTYDTAVLDPVLRYRPTETFSNTGKGV